MSNCFGIEFEFFSNCCGRGKLAGYLQNKLNIIARVCGYHQPNSDDERVFNTWQLQTDSSCQYELISPILNGDEGLVHLENIIREVNRSKLTRISDNCAIHNHIAFEPKYEELAGLIVTWFNVANIYRQLFPPNRRGSHYCADFRNSSYRCTIRRALNALKMSKENNFRSMRDWDRGCDINFTNINRLGTIEFRMMESTYSVHDIKNFVKLNQCVIDTGKKNALSESEIDAIIATGEMPNINTVNEFIAYIGADDGLKRWIKNRYKKFNPN